MSNKVTNNSDGKAISWGDSAPFDAEAPGVPPTDEHNVKLLDAVQPRSWDSPNRGDDFVYDLIAIGAGAGGLVSAKQTARRGGKSALIEKHMAGGDCLNYGCVPSKALLRCAKVSRSIHHAATGTYGGKFEGENTYKVDFPAVMSRMRRIRAQIAPADACSTSANVGVDIFNGHAKFVGPHEIEVNSRKLKFAKAVIATGGRAFVPPIPGLADSTYHTNESLFNLTEVPKRMVVMGAGPIGLEMAQAFANFGSEVTVLEMAPKILPREDIDAAKVVTEALVEDGVKFNVGIKFVKVDTVNGVTRVFTEHEGTEKVFESEVLLVATGRRANVENLGLEEAGVEYTRHGVTVSDALQTSNADVYSVGDVCTVYKFTHVAGTMAQMVVQNALFNGDNGVPRTVSKLVIPWVTYTEPEIAHVGIMDGEDATKYDNYVSQLEHNDRAICEGRQVGFVKIHCAKGTDKIVGATIVADAAGEMISELTLAVQFGIGLGQAGLGSVIHAYPTVADAIGGCAFQYKMKTWETLDKK